MSLTLALLLSAPAQGGALAELSALASPEASLVPPPVIRARAVLEKTLRVDIHGQRLTRDVAPPPNRPSPFQAASDRPLPPLPRAVNVHGIAVRGRRDFVRATRRALDKLRRTSRWAEIAGGIGEIRQYACSGMYVGDNPPTFRVGERTWRADADWYAGAIAHDSRHSQLYFAAKRAAGGREPAPETWSGEQGERLCIEYQLAVLAELRASGEMRRELGRVARRPTYQEDRGRPGRVRYDPLRPGVPVTDCGGQDW